MRNGALKAISIVAFLSSISMQGRLAKAAHSAYVVEGYDALPIPDFDGTPHPSSSNADIDISSGSAGYYNGLSGGSNGGATGNVSVYNPSFTSIQNATELFALAINVSDTAGIAHSLSADNDPALNDIVNDLDSSSFGGVSPLVAYSFNSVPGQYQTAASTLVSGEKNLGSPFDILVVITNPFPGLPPDQIFGSDFSNEVGNLDGITSLRITDAGAIPGPVVPEPVSAGLIAGGWVILLGRRIRTRNRE